MKGYGQFCPVAMAAEIFAERWTPLVLRGLLMGDRRFNELRRGVPLMSRSLLSTRLRALERAGLVERRRGSDGRGIEYALTPAGEEMRPIVVQLGVWGQRWARADMKPQHLDPRILMWDMGRRLHRDRLPPRRIVVLFEFPDAPMALRHFWLVLRRDEAEVCYFDPGFGVDLTVASDLLTFTRAWMGDIRLDEAIRSGRVKLSGDASLRRDLPKWLALSTFATVERPGPVAVDAQACPSTP